MKVGLTIGGLVGAVVLGFILKFVIAKNIVDTFGWVGGVALTAVCIMVALWIDKADRNKKQATREWVRDDAAEPPGRTKSAPSFYDILGVLPEAEPDLIKAAYRVMAKKYHPDINRIPHTEQFQAIQTAYETLSDPQRRTAYDQLFTPATEKHGETPFSAKPSANRENVSMNRFHRAPRARSAATFIFCMGGFILLLFLFIAGGSAVNVLTASRSDSLDKSTNAWLRELSQKPWKP